MKSLSPGLTLTEHTKSFLASEPEVIFVRAEDIADAALYILGTPPNVQVIYIILIK